MPNFSKRSKINGLVITRRQGEQVIINGGELRIEVVEVMGKCVRLAFLGNPEILIQRAEAVPNEGT